MLEIPVDLRLHVCDNLFSVVRERAKMVASAQLLSAQTKICLNEAPMWMKPCVHQRNKMTMVSTDSLFAVCGAVTAVNVCDPSSVNCCRKIMREMIALMRLENVEHRKMCSHMVMLMNQFECYWDVHSTRLKTMQDVKANVGVLARPMLKAKADDLEVDKGTIVEAKVSPVKVSTPKRRNTGDLTSPNAPKKLKKSATLDNSI